VLTKEMSKDERRKWAVEKAKSLLRAPRVKLPPSTIGSHIRAALESADHYMHASGPCRRFIGSLNRPHKLTADEITDRIVDELSRPINTWVCPAVPVPREWLAEVVAQAIQADSESRPVKPPRDTVPPVSDIGTRLHAALVTSFTQPGDALYRFSCGTCVNYISSLNHTTSHDPEKITADLLVSLQLPVWKREIVGGIAEQRVWLRAIGEETRKALGPS